MMTLLGYVWAFFAGVAIACQTGSNSELKERLGEPTAALVVNYVISVSCVLLYMLVVRQPVPGLERVGQVPWWAWLGGLLGAVSAMIAVILAKRIGAGALAACALAGQLAGSVVLDHFGWLGFELHSVNWIRIAGCCLIIFGVVLISKF